MSVGTELEKEKHIYATEVLDKKTCKKLSARLFDLKKQNKLIKDEQCPLSLAIYGDEEFEEVLENLAGFLSTTLGKKVLPTYCYARLYYKGEELKKHTDRPSCEISVTVTLDHDKNSTIWPISMGEPANISIKIGDGVIYKGCEIEHWRKPYKGKWQTQAFFHCVDAEGEHKELVFDARQRLNKPQEINLSFADLYTRAMSQVKRL